MNYHTSTLELFQQFFSFAEKLTEEELSDLSSGRKRLSIQLVKSKKLNDRKEPPSDFKRTENKTELDREKDLSSDQSIDLQKLRDMLESANSRDECGELLKDLRKLDLQELAKMLDIPIQSRDNIPTIKEKIVESTVGYKLRSRAIQSEDG